MKYKISDSAQPDPVIPRPETGLNDPDPNFWKQITVIKFQI